MKPKQLQTTTHIGIYTLFSGFLNVFQDVKLNEFWWTFKGLTYGELLAMVLPLLIGLWAIFYNEKPKPPKEEIK